MKIISGIFGFFDKIRKAKVILEIILDIANYSKERIEKEFPGFMTEKKEAPKTEA